MRAVKASNRKLVTQLGVFAVFALALAAIVANVTLRQGIKSGAEDLPTNSTGYIAPTPIPAQESLQQMSVRLLSDLPVDHKYFKLTFDLPSGKFLAVMYQGETSKRQFITWLKAKNFYPLYPSAFIVR